MEKNGIQPAAGGRQAPAQPKGDMVGLTDAGRIDYELEIHGIRQYIFDERQYSILSAGFGSRIMKVSEPRARIAVLTSDMTEFCTLTP